MGKFIKTYEELSPDLLRRASDKLANLGHTRRSRDMKLERIKKVSTELTEKYEKFGTVHINNKTLKEYGYNDVKENRYHFFLEFDNDLDYTGEPPPSGYDFKLPFRFNMIPDNTMIEHLYRQDAKWKAELEPGYMFLGDINLNYHVNLDGFEFQTVDFYESDLGVFNFVDRKSAVNVLGVIRKMFNGVNYPWPYLFNNELVASQSDFFKETIDDLPLLGDYGVEFDDLKSQFFKYKVNQMYKD
jgi:hypothetical protein